MPGSSTITGLMPCNYLRHLDSSKPRTCTFDAEIVIGFDATKAVQTATALLHHYNAPEDPPPVDRSLYYVVGKLVSMNNSMAVGDGHFTSEYDFVIFADVLHLISSDEESHIQPIRPSVIIAGTAGTRHGDRQFDFDVIQYAGGAKATAGYICTFPSNRRFGDNTPVPHVGRNISVTGFICRPAVEVFGDEQVKRVPVEINQLTFLGSDGVSSNTTPVKGKESKFSWASRHEEKPKDSDKKTIRLNHSVCIEQTHSTSANAADATSSKLEERPEDNDEKTIRSNDSISLDQTQSTSTKPPDATSTKRKRRL